jgi:hypothetical protein
MKTSTFWLILGIVGGVAIVAGVVVVIIIFEQKKAAAAATSSSSSSGSTSSFSQLICPTYRVTNQAFPNISNRISSSTSVSNLPSCQSLCDGNLK